MELVSHTRLIEELRQTDSLDVQCHALIFDAQTGELFAYHSAAQMSSLEAVSTAAVLYNTWGAQAETAQQHDDELEMLVTANAKSMNCLAQIRPAKDAKFVSSKDSYTLAIVGPVHIQIGAIKRLCKQVAQQLQSVLYQPAVSRKK